MRDETPVIQMTAADGLTYYLDLKAELKEEKGTEWELMKDLRSIIAQGNGLLEAHIFQTWRREDGMESVWEDPRWSDIEKIDAIFKEDFDGDYASDWADRGYTTFEQVHEDECRKLNGKLYRTFTRMDALLMAWGIVPMMDMTVAFDLIMTNAMMAGMKDNGEGND